MSRLSSMFAGALAALFPWARKNVVDALLEASDVGTQVRQPWKRRTKRGGGSGGSGFLKKQFPRKFPANYYGQERDARHVHPRHKREALCQ